MSESAARHGVVDGDSSSRADRRDQPPTGGAGASVELPDDREDRRARRAARLPANSSLPFQAASISKGLGRSVVMPAQSRRRQLAWQPVSLKSRRPTKSRRRSVAEPARRQGRRHSPASLAVIRDSMAAIARLPEKRALVVRVRVSSATPLAPNRRTRQRLPPTRNPGVRQSGGVPAGGSRQSSQPLPIRAGWRVTGAAPAPRE